MLNFKFQNPTKVIFGSATHKDVGSLINPETARMLLVYGSGSIKQNGVYDDVLDSLDENGIRYIELKGVKPNPRLSLVREGIALCKEKRINFVLAIGGGSVIDTAKAIAAGVMTDDDIGTFLNCPHKEVEKALPVGVILTFPGTGSECSNMAVIVDDETRLKRGLTAAAIIPKFAILNPEASYSMAPMQIAESASGMLGCLLERYFTQIKNVDVTDRLLEGAMKAVLVNAPRALKNPMDYNVRAEMMWSGNIAHNPLLSTGRLDDWAVHEISQELSGLYDLGYGMGLSILMPAWMKYVYKANVDKFAQLAARVFNVDWSFDDKDAIALEMIKRLELWYFEMGLPTRLREVKMGEEQFREIAESCMHSRDFIGTFKKLDKQDVYNIYKIAL